MSISTTTHTGGTRCALPSSGSDARPRARWLRAISSGATSSSMRRSVRDSVASSSPRRRSRISSMLCIVLLSFASAWATNLEPRDISSTTRFTASRSTLAMPALSLVNTYRCARLLSAPPSSPARPPCVAAPATPAAPSCAAPSSILSGAAPREKSRRLRARTSAAAAAGLLLGRGEEGGRARHRKGKVGGRRRGGGGREKQAKV